MSHPEIVAALSWCLEEIVELRSQIKRTADYVGSLATTSGIVGPQLHAHSKKLLFIIESMAFLQSELKKQVNALAYPSSSPPPPPTNEGTEDE